MLNVSLLRWSQPTTDHIKRESLRYYQTRVHFWSRSVKRSLGFRFFGGSHIWTHLQSRWLPIGVRFHGLNWIRSTWKCRELCGLFKYRTSDRFVWRGESLGTVSCGTLPFVMECLAFSGMWLPEHSIHYNRNSSDDSAVLWRFQSGKWAKYAVLNP